MLSAVPAGAEDKNDNEDEDDKDRGKELAEDSSANSGREEEEEEEEEVDTEEEEEEAAAAGPTDLDMASLLPFALSCLYLAKGLLDCCRKVNLSPYRRLLFPRHDQCDAGT